MENNYQLSRIHNYVNGLMNKDEMYDMEREALDDPFLQDAIEGYRLQQGVDARQLSLLQQRLSTRIEEQVANKNKRFYSWQRLAVGMAAGVMFVVVCVLLIMRYLPQQQRAAELTEVEIMGDHTFEVLVHPWGEPPAVPEMGWDQLGSFIAKNMAVGMVGEVSVRLQVDDQGKAYDISIKSDQPIQDEELKKILANKIKWEGRAAQFSIEFRKISI